MIRSVCDAELLVRDSDEVFSGSGSGSWRVTVINDIIIRQARHRGYQAKQLNKQNSKGSNVMKMAVTGTTTDTLAY